MRNNRNVRTGMNRTGFVRAVGAGAMGVAGAAMLGSNVARANSPPGTYKIGVMTSFGSWENAYPPYGDCARDIVAYAIENSRFGGSCEAVFPYEGTCGYSPVHATGVFNDLKSQGANFIVGVTCSSTLQSLFENPDYYAWNTTCMLNPGANSDDIEDCYVPTLDALFLDGTKHFRSTATPTSGTSIPLGQDILASVPNPKVAVFTGPSSGGTSVDGYAKGLSKGVIRGLGIDSNDVVGEFPSGVAPLVYSNAAMDCDSPGTLLVTKDDFKAKMLAAAELGANVFVLVPFANDSYAAAMVQAYQDANLPNTFLYGSASFSSFGPTGMRYVGGEFDPSKMINPNAWNTYVAQMKSATYMTNYNIYPSEYGIPSGAYPADNTQGWADNAVDAFKATWPDDHYLIAHVDSGMILAELAVLTRGNVNQANKALMSRTFPGFMGQYDWRSGNSFARLVRNVFATVVKDY